MLVLVKPNLSMTCYFTHIDASIYVANGILYNTARINDKPTQGVFIDPICMVNVIIEEFVYVHQLHYETCEKPKLLVRVHDGSTHPIIDSLTLYIQVRPKYS